MIDKHMNDKKFLTLIKNGICDNWNSPALTDMGGVSYLYSDFAMRIARLHIVFEANGIQKGDKIAICGKNSSHWAIVFFATVSYGAVATSILHDFTEDNVQNIVNHSDSKLLFVGESVWERLTESEMPALETIVMIDNFSIIKSKASTAEYTTEKIDELFAAKYPNGFTQADVIFHDEQADELAVLNYTSGTTSAPKGVMIPYRSLWSNTRFAIDSLDFVKSGDNVISMLPMAHMFGLAFEILLFIAMGCHIHFLTRVPSPQVILDAFSKVNPTLVVSVPLIIEKIIQGKVFPELNKQPVKTLIKIPFFRKKIYAKIATKLKPIFGNKMAEVAIGGAALNKEVGKFLSDIRFPYTVGYGMTECGPLISYVYWEQYKAESCGKQVDRMKVWIDSDNPETETGEIMTCGDNVMLGYYKNPEATKEVLDKEGNLKTGDLGIMDKDGNIFIKGRSKTMILGASGQNIYPEEIEDLFNNSPYIAESLVIEESGKLLVLIYADKDYLESHNIKVKDYDQIFSEELKAVNKRLPSYSKVTNLRLQDLEFEKTPKRSIKRFLYQK